MKGFFVAWMMGTAAAVAVDVGAMSWHFNMPETGVTPSAAFIDVVTDMSERHGKASSIGWQQYSLSIPFLDPRQSGNEVWHIGASANFELTAMHASGLDLKRDEFFHLNLPVTLIRPLPQGKRLVVAVVPTYDGDLETAGAAFDLGGYADYRFHRTETFSASVGLMVAPQRLAYGMLPFFGFEWNPTPEWQIKLQGYNLTAMRRMNERLSVGAFAKGEGGTWVVSTSRGDKLFSASSLVVGGRVEYDFAEPGRQKRILTASLGAVVSTSVKYEQLNREKKSIGTRHYHPGMYFSVGMDCRF